MSNTADNVVPLTPTVGAEAEPADDTIRASITVLTSFGSNDPEREPNEVIAELAKEVLVAVYECNTGARLVVGREKSQMDDIRLRDRCLKPGCLGMVLIIFALPTSHELDFFDTFAV